MVEAGCRRLRRVLALAAIAGIGLSGVLLSSAEAATKPQTVNVSLVDFNIVPDLASVSAGRIVFRVKNNGMEAHEMVVVSATSPLALPTKPDGSVNEDAIPKASKYGETGELAPGKSKRLAIKRKLVPGTYVLFCNIVLKGSNGTALLHFPKGMYTTLTVT